MRICHLFCVLLGFLMFCFPTMAVASNVAPSPSGTTIPNASQIVDASGNVWTLNASSTVLLNGSSAATQGWQTHQILYYDNLIYISGLNGPN